MWWRSWWDGAGKIASPSRISVQLARVCLGSGLFGVLAAAAAFEVAVPVEIATEASVQVDYRYHSYADETAFERDLHVAAFDIRRARIGIEGTIWDIYQGVVSADFAGTVKLRDGYINYALFDVLALRVGQFNSPYGNEAYGSSLNQEFIEDSTIATALSPGRDRGLMLHGLAFDKRWLYQFALMNGAGDNTADNNRSVDVLLRTQFGTAPGSDDFFQGWVGMSFTGGDQVVTEDTEIRLTTETASGTAYFKAVFPADEEYRRIRLNFNAAILIGPGMLKFEYNRMALTFDETAAMSGGSFMASVFLTGDQRTVKNGIFTRQDVEWPISEDELGAWEFAVRASWFDIDAAFFDANGLILGRTVVDPAVYVQNGFGVTVGLNWYPDEQARIMLNWVNSYAPDPTAEETTQGSIEQAMLARFQLAF